VTRTTLDELIASVPNGTAELLTPDETLTLKAWLAEAGSGEVAEITQVGRESLARACAGLPIRRGTMGLLRTALAARSGT
jgi:hypothetical protein